MRAHVRYKVRGEMPPGPDGYWHSYDCGPEEVVDLYAGRGHYKNVTDVEIIETGRDDVWVSIRKMLKAEKFDRPRKPPTNSWE